MPDPNDRPAAGAPRDDRPVDEATIRDEEAHQDAETARRARDEALAQGAVPWPRVKDDAARRPDGPGA